MYNQSKKKLGELLIESEQISEEQLENLLILQKNSGRKIGEIIAEEGILNEQQIIEVLEFQLRIPRYDFDAESVQPDTPKLISENLARKYMLIPVKREDNALTVAMYDPLDLGAIDVVKVTAGLEIKPVLALKSSIVNAIERYYGKESAEKAPEKRLKWRTSWN
jgi:type IV pilus assembly protein PilB